MNILLIGKRNHLFWDDHVEDAFKRLGHQVYHFRINDRPLIINLPRQVLKVFDKKLAQKISDRWLAWQIVKKMRNRKIDFVFVTSACFISPSFYEVLKELHVPIVAWDGDGCPSYPIAKVYVDLIDILFESEKRYVQENKWNFKEIYYLPFAANERVFFDKKLERKEHIFFAGAATKRRKEFLKEIDDIVSLKIRGWGWNELRGDVLNKKLHMREIVDEYNQALAVINIHQEINHIDALNMRTFEVPATNTLLINDYREELDDQFEIDKEIVVFATIEELREKVMLYYKDKELRKKVALNGYKRVLAQHTYVHRMDEVLRIVK